MSDGEVLGFPHGYGQLTNPDVYAQTSTNPAPLKVYTSNPSQSPAAKILQTASDLIDGDRDKQHGDRLVCHQTIAALWGVYLGLTLTAKDVALMMALLKIARTKTGTHTPDTYT